MTGYSDASYAPGSTDRKSISGFTFMMNGGPISWQSKKQKIVATSSMEAEYIGLSLASKEAIWLRKFLSDLGLSLDPVVIYEDNQASIKTAKDIVHNDRSKHIDVRYHFIRQHVAQGTLLLKYLESPKMIADIFTKALGSVLHARFCNLLGLIQLQGGC